MGKAKGTARIARGLTDMSPPVVTRQDDPRWSPDPERPVDEYSIDFPIAGLGRLKGRQSLDAETGRIVEFALSAQIERDGTWHSIARIDTRHEEVHLHILNRRGDTIVRRVIRIIRGPEDVDSGWDESVTVLTDDWEEHERRWTNGR